MSVKVSRPRSNESAEWSTCMDEGTCDGERFTMEHGTRVCWWLVAGLLILSLILLGYIVQHAFNTEATGPWSALHASTFIMPTPRALGSLVGIVLTLDLYTCYMMAYKKGHLDKYVGQFLLSAVLKCALWLFFLYGLSFGGFIGSMLALITLLIMNVWGFMTSHSCAALHAWISIAIDVFIVFLMIWLTTCGVTIWPGQ